MTEQRIEPIRADPAPVAWPPSVPAALERDVVILGGGFGGLACAQALGGTGLSIAVVDRQNVHVFQPLLYQVATAALSPADIAQPIRRILAAHENVDVLMGEVMRIDTEARTVVLADRVRIQYRALVIATGSVYNYFGHDMWKAWAPSLKTVEDARRIRGRLLRNFEEAEICADPERQRALMTSIIIGGGPTGVEMAGAVAELARWSLAEDFRRIDPTQATTILIEAGPRILSAFPTELSDYARHELARLGVTVETDTAVEGITDNTVTVAGRTRPAGLIVWAAGIRASPAARWLGVEPDRIGRIPVSPDLSVAERPGVFAIGDVAALVQDGAALPALAQVAKQQGTHLGRALASHLKTGSAVAPFRFKDRGNTAVIGRHAAVFDFGRRRLTGRLAWLLWAIVHVALLVGFERRVLVVLQWLWRYATYERGARLIP